MTLVFALRVFFRVVAFMWVAGGIEASSKHLPFGAALFQFVMGAFVWELSGINSQPSRGAA